MTELTAAEAHARILAAARRRYYAVVEQRGPDSAEAVGWAGRRRILERHAPAAPVGRWVECVGGHGREGDEMQWVSCGDFQDAAAGLGPLLPDPDDGPRITDAERAMPPEQRAGRDFARQHGIPDVADDDARFTLLDPDIVVFRPTSSPFWAELVLDKGVWSARCAGDAFPGLFHHSFAELVDAVAARTRPTPMLVAPFPAEQ